MSLFLDLIESAQAGFDENNVKYGAQVNPFADLDIRKLDNILESVKFDENNVKYGARTEPLDGIVTIPQEQLDSYMDFVFGNDE